MPSGWNELSVDLYSCPTFKAGHCSVQQVSLREEYTPESNEFNPPPNWPPAPIAWHPEPGWQPDPAWGPAPAGWDFRGTSNDTPAPSAVETPLRIRGRSQQLWLVCYWVATALRLLFLATAVIGEGEPVGLTSYLGVGFGTFAAVSGALMATDLSKRGVSDVVFDEATAGMRVISVGWFLFAIVMISLAWRFTEPGAERSAGIAAAVEATQSLTTTLFGVGALFAIVGPSYSAYQSAREKLTLTTSTPSEPQR